MFVDIEKHGEERFLVPVDLGTMARIKNVVACDTRTGQLLVIRTDGDCRRVSFAGRTIYDLIERDFILIDRRMLNRMGPERIWDADREPDLRWSLPHLTVTLDLSRFRNTFDALAQALRKQVLWAAGLGHPWK